MSHGEERLRSHLDKLRPVLGVTFLVAYIWQTFVPGSFGTDLFLGLGTVMFTISVPWSPFERVVAATSRRSPSSPNGRCSPLNRLFDTVKLSHER